MASFITANETLTQRHNGSISRSFPTIIGRLLDEAGGVHCGRVVAPGGTTNDECLEPTTAALVVSAYGFTVYGPMHEPADLTDGTPHYADNTMVSIMTKGSMYVDCEGTVVAGAPVFVRFTSDGGDNTELGKVRGDADGTVVLDTTAAAVEGLYGVVLYNGLTEETFTYESDGSQLASEVIAALVTAINTSAAYSAAGTTEITVTRVLGSHIEVRSFIAPTEAAKALWTLVDNQKAAILPGAYFTESRTGAGLVEINFDRNGGI